MLAPMKDSHVTAGTTAPPPWRTCLDFDRQDPAHYDDHVLTPLFDLVQESPRRVLELGCAGGAFGAELKRRFPGASVVGIDAGEGALKVAATRLDDVIHAQLDEIDFAARGLVHGEFDMLIAADILEHLVNPWDLLVRVKPFLSPRAQMLVSIPNVRNLTVAAALLVGGTFEYTERGLLDVTHLRFFTLDSIHQMFEQTGYGVEKLRPILLPQLGKLYQELKGGTATLRFGRLALEGVSAEEAAELCAMQFILRCRPT